MKNLLLVGLFFVALPSWAVHYKAFERNDWFEREPFIAHFQWGQEDFSLIGIHIKPNKARDELLKMDEVYEHAQAKLRETDAFLLGDFNAGCNYLSPYQEYNLDIYQDTRFEWLIDYYTDTNVALSQCAYDRIVKVGDIYSTQGRVHREGIGKGISDHYLVYTQLYSGKETLRVAAWNIQRLGEKKARRHNVMRMIAEVVKGYDVILIQEILGDTDVPMDLLMRELPWYYRLAQSPAIGRTSYKERYAYVYDSRKLSLKESYVFPD